MSQYAFGAGSLWATPAGDNPTPVRFGVVQTISVDFTGKAVPLFGNDQLPVSVARGTVQVGGKIDMGKLDPAPIALFFNTAILNQEIFVASREPGTVPATPFEITVTNAATFASNLGVVDAITGFPFVCVASSPASGQYAVDTSTGVYTFSSDDEGRTVLFDYIYTGDMEGSTVLMNNQPMGEATTFTAAISVPYQGKQTNIVLTSCVATKFSMATQLEDFTKPSFEYSAFANDAGLLGYISTAEGYALPTP